MKVAIVTGASRGIGKACAIRLAKDGYTVVINYASNDQKAQEVLDEIKANGGDGMLYKADVSDLEQVKKLVRDVYNEYKQIDVLINNAGIARDEYVLMLNKDNVDRSFDINVKGYFYMAQQVGLKMFRKKSGVIINMSSVSGSYFLPGQATYSATKAAVNAFTKTLAKELSPSGIRVCGIAPGFIRTDMTDNLPEDKKEEYYKAIPLHRFAEVEEVSSLVSFLVSDSASYITGQTITIDGGLSI